jgi:predicted HicB family RNase H-like nuclease
MAQSGWRLPDDLLRRVRVRCAEEGVRQNAWVERALEKALGTPRTG